MNHINLRIIRNILGLTILIILGSFLALIGTKKIDFFHVPTSSMEPTFMPGDNLVSIRKDSYERGDVIVLKDPEEEGAFLLKRLVAIGGDTVSVTLEGLKVNNVVIREPYLYEIMEYTFEPYTLAEDEIFVLGDHRNKSADSHKWGHGVPADTITGRICYIYAPRDRSGKFIPNTQVFAAVTP